MLKKILAFVVAAVALLLAVIATRPADFKVERSRTVAAPPAVVYDQIADFGRWAAWSPWAKLDPAMKATVSGAPAAVGHGYAWAGNDKVGEGRMTIAALEPGRRVDIRLEFQKPMAAENPTTFALAPEGAGTRVTWTMTGHNGFVGRAFTLFMDMDKMVGGDFERGLASLQGVAEAEAAKAPPPQAGTAPTATP
jgi:uncharacterized protein YndB with AHSA1/START domain